MQSLSPQHLTWIARAMGLVMLVLALVAVYAVATCYDSPVDPYRLDALYEGATKQEVLEAIGEPTSIEDDGRKWLFSRFMKVRVVQIRFDDEELLVSRGYTDSDAAALDDASATEGEADFELEPRGDGMDEPVTDTGIE